MEEQGYHLRKIPKGVLGEESKIIEEWLEFLDAEEQGSKIMMMVELADMYGAVEAYSNALSRTGINCAYWNTKLEQLAKGLNLTLKDLKIFSDITKRAFESGVRK